jgi:hypothetical protein
MPKYASRFSFLRALHLNIFEQPPHGIFQQPQYFLITGPIIFP